MWRYIRYIHIGYRPIYRPRSDISAYIGPKRCPVKFCTYRIVLDKIPISRLIYRYISRDLKQWYVVMDKVAMWRDIRPVVESPLGDCMTSNSGTRDVFGERVTVKLSLEWRWFRKDFWASSRVFWRKTRVPILIEVKFRPLQIHKNHKLGLAIKIRLAMKHDSHFWQIRLAIKHDSYFGQISLGFYRKKEIIESLVIFCVIQMLFLILLKLIFMHWCNLLAGSARESHPWAWDTCPLWPQFPALWSVHRCDRGDAFDDLEE